MQKRISWDELCIAGTVLYGLRSTCMNYKIGAVFFNPNKKLILCGGYNGAPSGSEHCLDTECFKKKNGISVSSGSGQCAGTHAEINAIGNAAKHGINISNSVIYCSYSPCWACAKQLVNLGITEFVYRFCYHDDYIRVSNLFNESGINIRSISINGIVARTIYEALHEEMKF